jgi:hypothetical protein
MLILDHFPDKAGVFAVQHAKKVVYVPDDNLGVFALSSRDRRPCR